MDTGHIAWMLTSTALVLFMTPGLAFFYGGLVRGRNVVSTLMYSFIAMGVASIVWVLWGFSLAFNDASNIGWSGGFDFIGLSNIGVGNGELGWDIPDLLVAAFQMTFAIITPALITGAFRRAIQVHDVPDFLGVVGDFRLRSDLLLGLGWWLDRQPRRRRA